MEGEIRSVKGRFDSCEIYEVYALCMYQPTWEKFRERARGYMAEDTTELYAYISGDRITGVIAVKRQPENSAEILGIAVEEAFRGRGIGQSLVEHVIRVLSPRKLLAETDDDAVAFYRKSGFEARSFFKNGAYRRYCCTWLKR